MSIKKYPALTAAFLLPALMSSTLLAEPAHKFMVSGMALKLSPADKQEAVVSSNPYLPNPTGIDLSADDNTLPALGFTYWLSDTLALETYLSVPSNHHISIHGLEAYGINGFSEVASADLLPVTVFAQYFYPVPDTKLTLMVGGGLVYAIVRNIKVNEQVLTQLDPTLQFDASNSWGGGLQVGAMFDITPDCVVRISYGLMKFSTDANITTSTPFGNLSTSMAVDPSVLMLGVGYKF